MAERSATARVDVLHPLAHLDPVRCLSWENVQPAQCVILQDKVAILQWQNDASSGDYVHISSTNDLSSWTSTQLPYRYTSLSTYKDQLVAVGGQYPSTFSCTNELLASSNGHNWQPTLPAMPTKRYLTSSVSARSPAILVVAGGRDSTHHDLDIVEVLLGNRWIFVAPLPIACSNMRSTLHADSIYFTRGPRQEGTMYTSTCESLCIGNVFNNKTWMKIQAPDYTWTIASWASRLITIDGHHVIRGYSNGHWIEMTVKDWNYIMDRTAAYCLTAAELPTGGLVVACGDGVYTLILSVDTFDPDSYVISDVFSRLEAVMDIQVVSVLTNLHKQLTTASGVDMPHEGWFFWKVPIPNPKESPHQYLIKLMSHWSLKRHSSDPPTWRELLLVLQKVGQQELGHWIETFMKDSGFTRSDYPPLPKFVDGQKKVLAGFSPDNEISVRYKGERGSLDWEECGLTMLFESSDDSSGDSECPVHVSAGESGAFRYPPRVEQACRAYHIDSPKQIPAPVTMRIKHNVPEEDVPHLRFMTCSEHQPPYDYTIINEGTFTATTAEISVTGFKGSFFYILGKLKMRVKGILSIWEKSYAASIHCSVQPTQSISAYSWKVYVSIVKNCVCFIQSIKKFIREEYEEDVKLEVSKVVRFVGAEQNVTAVSSCEPSSLRNYIHMNPCASPVIKKVDIDRYVDAIPPHIRYKLRVPLRLEEASVKIKITLRGLQEADNFLFLDLIVPQLSSPPPAPLPNRSYRLSSELESSAQAGYSLPPASSLERSTSSTSPEQEPCTRSDYAFSMKNLLVLHIGPNNELHLIEEMSSQWEEAGNLLGLRISHTRVIQENNPRNVVDCCRKVMAEWLDDEKRRYNYPPSWEGLCELLKDLRLTEAAEIIQKEILK